MWNDESNQNSNKNSKYKDNRMQIKPLASMLENMCIWVRSIMNRKSIGDLPTFDNFSKHSPELGHVKKK